MIGFIASLQAVFFATEEEKLVISKLRPDLTEYEFNIMMSEVFPLTGSILAAVAFVWTVVSVICFLRLRRPTC
ncbi:MAG: hypothetical protein EOP88_12605 [Verrucomicrobiaceae bacterium]|nr:MAG: hypothetical protein EOP88_12605 [Verrucomicrobiaceae bacterium]